MSAISKLGVLAVVGGIVALLFHACASSGPGSDFDEDGLKDTIEDRNDNFQFDPGETDFVSADTDHDGLCDGKPEHALPDCTGCEDCNNDGFWEPCLGETDPRGIYGEATPEEAQSLAEDGVEFMPIPSFPEDRN